MHVVGVGFCGNIDHPLPRHKRVTPANPHLDRIIAGEDHAIGCFHQWQQLRITNGREACPAHGQRIVLGNDTLGLVGRNERNIERPAETLHLASAILGQNIKPADHDRLLGFRQLVARLCQCSSSRCHGLLRRVCRGMPVG